MQNREFVFIFVLFILLGILHSRIKVLPTPQEVSTLAKSFQKTSRWTGRFAPDFSLDLMDGTRFRLADHIGKKTIVLNFFATWCAPCRSEMPELNRFYAEHKGDDFLLLGIDRKEKRDRVREFIRQLRVDFPIAIDIDSAVFNRYEARELPTTVVISASGRVVSYQRGAIRNADAVLGPILKNDRRLLAAGKGITRDHYLRRSLRDSGR